MLKPMKKNKKNRKLNQGSSLITVTKPNDIVSEQFKTIRTNIKFSMIDQSFKSIMVTSSGENEGKSTISANLASVIADTGQRVLLIDADLRKPTIHRTFNISSRIGLTSILTENDLDLMDTVQYSKEANVYLLPAGIVPPNPSELLASKRMVEVLNELEVNFDIIIIDTPPIMAVTDAQIVSNLVDGVVLVVREDVSERNAVKKSVELLNVAGANILGAVYNAADTHKGRNYYGYSYKSEYGDQEENE